MKQFASGRLFFIFMSVIYNWSDMEMRNSRTLDKNRKERNDFSDDFADRSYNVMKLHS